MRTATKKTKAAELTTEVADAAEAPAGNAGAAVGEGVSGSKPKFKSPLQSPKQLNDKQLLRMTLVQVYAKPNRDPGGQAKQSHSMSDCAPLGSIKPASHSQRPCCDASTNWDWETESKGQRMSASNL
jgi:hypothetical protein